VHEVVRAVGWDGAQALLDEEFTGWEAGFLRDALALLADVDLRLARREEHRTLAAFLGLRR
jgi:hypothetical protein